VKLQVRKDCSASQIGSHPMGPAFGSLRVLLLAALVGIFFGNQLPGVFPEWLVQSISSLILIVMMFLCGRSLQRGTLSNSWGIFNAGRGPILVALGLSLSIFAVTATVCFALGWTSMGILFMMLSVAPVANSSVGWTEVDQATDNAYSNQVGSSAPSILAYSESINLTMIALSWIPFLIAVIVMSFVSSTSANLWNILVTLLASILGVVLGMVFGRSSDFQRYTLHKSSQLSLACIGVLNLLAAYGFASSGSVWAEWQGISSAILIAAIIFSSAIWVFTGKTNASTSRVLIRGAVMKNTGIFSAFTLASGGSSTILAALMTYTIAQHFFAAFITSLKNSPPIAEPQSSAVAA